MKFEKSSLLLIILTLVSLGLFIFSQLYLKASGPIDPVQEKLLDPITPNLDTSLIEELRKSQNSN